MSGKPARVLHIGGLPKACNITLLASLANQDQELFYYESRIESNTQKDFMLFLVNSIEKRFLVPGDFLVVDNATVHVGATHLTEIDSLLKQFHITLVTLPTYSPELNPCELVFSSIKRWIRSENSSFWDQEKERYSSHSFAEILNAALKKISFAELSNYYATCRKPKTI